MRLKGGGAKGGEEPLVVAMVALFGQRDLVLCVRKQMALGQTKTSHYLLT